jgi:parallel beta-helix repeat protein
MGRIGKTTVLSLTLLLCLIFVLVPSSTVKAQTKTLVVPDQYPTINAAVGNASAGDTVFIKKGNYFEYGLNIDKPLRLVGQDSNNTILRGNRGSRSYSPMLFISSSDVEISCLSLVDCYVAIECRGNSLHGITVSNSGFFNNSAGVTTTSKATITVTACSFENNQNAILLSDLSNNSIISKNIVASNDYGIDASGNNTRIINNIITKNSFGIRLASVVNGNIQGNLIQNNVNKLNSTSQYGYGIQFDTSTSNTTVSNNSIEGNTIGINLRNYLLIGTTVTNVKGTNNFVFTNNFDNIHANVNIEYQYPYAEAYRELKQEIPNNIINGTDIVYWDNGTVGNYWSNFTGNGSYVIDENNIDNHPLIQPVIIPTVSPAPNFILINDSWFELLVIASVIVSVVIGCILLFRRHRKTSVSL